MLRRQGCQRPSLSASQKPSIFLPLSTLPRSLLTLRIDVETSFKFHTRTNGFKCSIQALTHQPFCLSLNHSFCRHVSFYVFVTKKNEIQHEKIIFIKRASVTLLFIHFMYLIFLFSNPFLSLIVSESLNCNIIISVSCLTNINFMFSHYLSSILSSHLPGLLHFSVSFLFLARLS